MLDPLASGGFTPYLWAFGQGILVDFTPCVYPLIPITVAVFGAKGVSRGRALFLATAYVLGMATLYTGIGIVASLTGAAFGAWLGNPWVVVPVAGLLVALALSMFGFFDLQLPSSLQGRLNQVGGAGPIGAFLMGLVSGLISAPCTGPVLVGLLTYIAASSAEGHGVMHGGSLLFTYALGMGSIFFAVALGASLFRPGPWMEYIKSTFGVALLVMALWFLRPVSPALEGLILHPEWGIVGGLALALAGIGLGAIHLSFHAARRERLRKAAAVGLTVFGAVVAINGVLWVPPSHWTTVTTLEALAAELDAAHAQERPLVIDFAAKWCLPCKEIEAHVFHHPEVEDRLRGFHLIKVDVSEGTDEQTQIQQAFASLTLPSVLLYPRGADLSQHRATLQAGGDMPPPQHRFDGVGVETFLSALGTVIEPL